MTSDPTTLWASARLAELLDDQDAPPKYGTAEWRRLSSSDARKTAALIHAAELWRRFGDEEDLLSWFRDASRSRTPLADRKSLAELNAFAKPKPPRPVQATAGWPPIAIPGRPGWYRHLADGKQIDKPHGQQEAAA